LVRVAFAVEHGVTGVEDDVGDEVGLLLVLLDRVAFASAVALPVDVARVVAGDVLAVLHELDGEALERTLVLADAQPLDDAAGLQAQRGGAVEDFRVQRKRHANSEEIEPRKTRKTRKKTKTKGGGEAFCCLGLL